MALIKLAPSIFLSFYPFVRVFLAAYGIFAQITYVIQCFANGDYLLGFLGFIELGGMIVSIFQTCFTGDTLVVTEDGNKRIDEIEVGDKVWAYNPETGETALKEVVRVYEKETDVILHLQTTDGDIDTTTTHPFYVVGEGWKAAGDLKIGDKIYALDGTTVTITATTLEKLAKPIKVYNLEVADFHTYFVGNTGMLVHNQCGPSKGSSNAGGEVSGNGTGGSSSSGGSGGGSSSSSGGKGWHTGDPIDKPTYKGTDPKWTTARQRYWKNEAYYNGNSYSPENLARMKKGLAPQRYNTKTGQWESMELHHIDPQRNGGANSYDNLMPLWPEEHARIDDYRHIGGR